MEKKLQNTRKYEEMMSELLNLRKSPQELHSILTLAREVEMTGGFSGGGFKHFEDWLRKETAFTSKAYRLAVSALMSSPKDSGFPVGTLRTEIEEAFERKAKERNLDKTLNSLLNGFEVCQQTMKAIMKMNGKLLFDGYDQQEADEILRLSDQVRNRLKKLASAHGSDLGGKDT